MNWAPCCCKVGCNAAAQHAAGPCRYSTPAFPTGKHLSRYQNTTTLLRRRQLACVTPQQDLFSSARAVHGKALRDRSQNLRSPIAESYPCDNTRRSCRLASRSCDARWQIVSQPQKKKKKKKNGRGANRKTQRYARCKVGGRPADRLHCTSTFADASALTSRLIKGHARASESTSQQHKANCTKPELPLECASLAELRCHTHTCSNSLAKLRLPQAQVGKAAAQLCDADSHEAAFAIAIPATATPPKHPIYENLPSFERHLRCLATMRSICHALCKSLANDSPRGCIAAATSFSKLRTGLIIAKTAFYGSRKKLTDHMGQLSWRLQAWRAAAKRPGPCSNATAVSVIKDGHSEDTHKSQRSIEGGL